MSAILEPEPVETLEAAPEHAMTDHVPDTEVDFAPPEAQPLLNGEAVPLPTLEIETKKASWVFTVVRVIAWMIVLGVVGLVLLGMLASSVAC